MVFSTLIMWILCLFVATTSAQEVTSTLPASNRTCPGTRITFNCSITGSDSVTNLIIAWSSPEYIGQEALLQFTTNDMMGDSVTSMINDDVIAQLIYNGDRNGIPTLESQLQLTASSNFVNPTITCQSSTSGAMRSITFYILSIPGLLHNARGTKVPTVHGRCLLFVTWQAPLVYDEENIDYYFVKSPSTSIRTNEKSTFLSLIVPNCILDPKVSISAVDRCGREGPSTVIVVQLDSSTLNETVCTHQVTTPQENQSGSDDVSTIAMGAMGAIGGSITIIVVILVTTVFLYILFRNRLNTCSPLEEDRREIELQDEQINLGSKDDPKIVNGRTALLPASRSGITDLLVDSGGKLDNKDKCGQTALHHASNSGCTGVVKLLVDSGAQFDNKDKDGWTALHLASNSGLTGVVKLLVDSGAQIDNEDEDCQTALHLASSSGHTGVVKVLVDSGAQIDNKDKNGWTALHLASYSGHTEMVKLLVDSGAQIGDKDNKGWTALHFASNSGHSDVVELLVDADAQIDNKDEDGRTALERASYSGHTDVVKLLIDSGAQVDSEDSPHEIYLQPHKIEDVF